MYLPKFIKKQAEIIQENYPNSRIIFGELGYYNQDNLSEQENFIKSLKENSTKQLIFIDLVLTERNLYFPLVFFMALKVMPKLGLKTYKKYMEYGGIFGFFDKNNIPFLSSSLICGGSVAVVVVNLESVQ